MSTVDPSLLLGTDRVQGLEAAAIITSSTVGKREKEIYPPLEIMWILFSNRDNLTLCFYSSQILRNRKSTKP